MTASSIIRLSLLLVALSFWLSALVPVTRAQDVGVDVGGVEIDVAAKRAED